MSFEAAEAVDGKSILFVDDGSTNKFGGVEDHVNSLGAIVRGYGMDPEVMVAEGRAPKEIAARLLTNFFPEEIRVTRTRFDTKHSTLIEQVAHKLTGASNYIAPPATNVQRAAIRSSQYDIAHFMWPNQPQHGGRIAKFFGEVSPDTALIGTYHITSSDLAVNAMTRATAIWQRKSLRRFDAEIAVSPVAAKHGLETGFFKEAPMIIPNPVDVKFFESARPFSEEEITEKGVPKADKYIVTVGRLDDRKGVGELLEGFAGLNDVISAHADVHLVICGDGLKEERERYVQQAEALGIKNVSFIGQVSHEDKARWLKTANLAVFASKYGETQAIVLAEAMAAGTPVVASNIDGHKFTFSVYDNYKELPYLFNPQFDSAETPDQRQNMIYQFAECMYNHLVFEDMIKAARKEQSAIVKEFDILVIEKKLIDVYGNVLSRKSVA